MVFSETFLWGSLGSLLSYLAIFILPQLRAFADKEEMHVSCKHVMLFLGIAVIMILGGGLFAVIIGDASLPKHAAFYGAGWEAGAKGLAGAGNQVLKT